MPQRLVLLHALDSSALASLADRRKDARVERRIIALRQISLGRTAQEAADVVGVNEKTIQEWVAAFNEEGIASVLYDKYKGAIPHLTPEQEEGLLRRFAKALRRR